MTLLFSYCRLHHRIFFTVLVGYVAMSLSVVEGFSTTKAIAKGTLNNGKVYDEMISQIESSSPSAMFGDIIEAVGDEEWVATTNGNSTEQHGNGDDTLSYKILGFYPFPTPPPKGILGWFLRDTHQAILIESKPSSSSSSSKSRASKGRRQRNKHPKVLLDFMTKDGEFHPVWYDEPTKWSVMLGSNIEGEVRTRVLGRTSGDDVNNDAMIRRQPLVDNNNNNNNDTSFMVGNSTSVVTSIDNNAHINNINQTCAGESVTEEEELPSLLEYTNTATEDSYTSSMSPKMQQILQIAESYNCQMNLYTNNCRMFVAAMEREIERLNCDSSTCSSDNNDDVNTPHAYTTMVLADLRMYFRMLLAILLPTIYPLFAILALYEGFANV